MKRVISLLLVAVMALALIACGTTEAPATEAAPATADVAMQYITRDEAKTLLENDEYVFFDIRKAADSSANSIPGALAYDMDAAKEGDAEAGKATMTKATEGLDKKIILVCYSGKRYAQAATNALSAIGYDMSKVYTLEGGFTGWSENLPELTTGYVPAEPVELVVGMRTSVVKPMGVYIADAKGWFEEEGVKVTFEKQDKPAMGYTAVQENQFDLYLFAATPMASDTVKGATNMVVVGGSISEGTEIIGKIGSQKLVNIEDFVGGKKYVCLKTETGQVMLKDALVKAGYTINVDPENDKTEADAYFSFMADTGSMIAAVKAGEADYAITNAGYGFSKAAKNELEVSGYVAQLTENGTYACCRQVTSKETIADKRAGLVGFYVAQLRGYQYFLNEENKQEVGDILAAWTEQPAAEMIGQIYGSETYTPSTKVTVDPQTKATVSLFEAMENAQLVKANDIDWTQYIDTSIYSEALQILQDREPNEQLWKDLRAEFEANN